MGVVSDRTISMNALIAKMLQSGGETAVDTVNTLALQFAREAFAVSKYAKENLSDPFLSTLVKELLKVSYIGAIYDSLQQDGEISIPDASSAFHFLEKAVENGMKSCFAGNDANASPAAKALRIAARQKIEWLENQNFSEQMRKSIAVQTALVLRDAMG